jgi:OmpA-OmpF porin, OOP family
MKINHRAIAAIACGLLLTPAVYAVGDPGAYWTNPEGEVYKNAAGECWKKPDWTKADATRECDPDLVPKPKPKPKPIVKPAPAPVPKTIIEEVNLTADTYFAFDSAKLRPNGLEAIRQLVERVENVNGLSIEVAGHTDSIGTEEYNQKLSVRRAASVKNALVKEGIPVGAITTRGYGETAPIVPNTSPENRAKNRRVDITVRGNKKVIKKVMPEPTTAVPSPTAPAMSFDRMDKDDNGYLSAAELKANKKLSAQMKGLDTDKDEQLSETEFGGFKNAPVQGNTPQSINTRSTEAPQ